MWQGQLEAWYPSYVDSSAPIDHPKKKKDDVSDEEKTSMRPLPVSATAPTASLSKLNILKKLAWDQCFGSPLNNVIFLVVMGLMGGAPWEQIRWNVNRVSGNKLFPLSLIIFIVFLLPLPFEELVLVIESVCANMMMNFLCSFFHV